MNIHRAILEILLQIDSNLNQNFKMQQSIVPKPKQKKTSKCRKYLPILQELGMNQNPTTKLAWFILISAVV